MSQLIDTRTVPQGGWNYRQPESSALLSARTWRGLVKAVRAHREAMGYDLAAGWEERLEAEVVAQNPQLAQKHATTLDDVKRCAHTLKAWSDAGKPLVDMAEAEWRAGICASCPRNQRVVGCFGCAAVGTVLEWVIGERKTSQDDKLKQCSVCGCNIKTKLLFPLDVTDSAGLDYPSWCWAKKN